MQVPEPSRGIYEPGLFTNGRRDEMTGTYVICTGWKQEGEGLELSEAAFDRVVWLQRKGTEGHMEVRMPPNIAHRNSASLRRRMVVVRIRKRDCEWSVALKRTERKGAYGMVMIRSISLKAYSGHGCRP